MAQCRLTSRRRGQYYKRGSVYSFDERILAHSISMTVADVPTTAIRITKHHLTTNQPVQVWSGRVRHRVS